MQTDALGSKEIPIYLSGYFRFFETSELPASVKVVILLLVHAVKFAAFVCKRFSLEWIIFSEIPFSCNRNLVCWRESSGNNELVKFLDQCGPACITHRNIKWVVNCSVRVCTNQIVFSWIVENSLFSMTINSYDLSLSLPASIKNSCVF